MKGMKAKDIKILGSVDKNYRMEGKEKAYPRVLITDIPSMAIARNVLKLSVMVVDV